MESKTGPRRVRHAERKYQALGLRSRGLTVRAVAREIGCSGAQAHRLICDALAELQAQTQEAAEKLRDLELERLDEMLVGLWEAATTGDTQAVTAALRISERRAKLLGLDTPSRVEASGPNGAPLKTWVECFSPDYSRLSDGELAQLEVLAEKLAPPAVTS